MSDLPLNAVENKRDDINAKMDPNFGKSPRKLSTSEKRVIKGLQQLTNVLFEQHLLTNLPSGSLSDNTPSDSMDVADGETTSDEENDASTINTTKENQQHIQQLLEFSAIMKNGAEQFCSMIVQQLTADEHIELNEEWHDGQLNAYDSAHRRLFKNAEGADGHQQPNVVRKLTEF